MKADSASAANLSNPKSPKRKSNQNLNGLQINSDNLMKRIQEKVKDIVEVRSYESISDFLLNPAQTLLKYHFTDMTSDLMAKWLDNITNVQFQNGSANALAGYRGVGKSHFLATLGAVVSQPELRSRITDSHVSTSASRSSLATLPCGKHARRISPTPP